MINFPDNPKLGDAFTYEGTIYSCVAVMPIVWNASPASAGIPDAPTDGKNYGRKNASWAAVTKSDVGLSAVDNTPDSAKAVSGPQQSALNLKENTIAVGTAAQYWRGDKTWQTLNKAAVGLGSVDNTPDGSKTVQSALYMRSGANPAGALMPFSWSDDGTQPTYVWGGNNAEGKVYNRANLSVNYANGSGYANNAGQVSGIGGWSYSNWGNNATYLWATEGDAQSQHLTRPENLLVAWANRVGSVESAGGGTLQSDLAVNGNMWSNNGFVRSYTGFKCRESSGGTEGGNVFNFFWNSPSLHAYVDHTYMGAVMFSSDERIKKDIETLESHRDEFMAIRPIRFHYRDISLWRDDGKEYWGFSAQNLLTCVPRAVDGDIKAVTKTNDVQPAAVNDRPILALTVVEVQQLIREVADLKERITVLEAGE